MSDIAKEIVAAAEEVATRIMRELSNVRAENRDGLASSTVTQALALGICYKMVISYAQDKEGVEDQDVTNMMKVAERCGARLYEVAKLGMVKPEAKA